jgi:DNA-binding transcriptional LysR family regulator
MTQPFIRLRRRVGNSMPSRPSDVPGFNAADNGSPVAGSATMSSRLGSGLVVNTVQAALDAAVNGGGILRPHSYQSKSLERSGDLRKILAAYESPPIPIRIVHPAGRYLPPKLRLFIDEAVSALRAKLGSAAS